MTAHLHDRRVAGCYRCELSADEAGCLPDFVCPLCEDEGVVAVDFGIESTGIPRIEPCPECNGGAS